MNKSKVTYKLFFAISFLFIISQEIINAQIVISRPNLGFSQACASDSFNTFNTTFNFSPESALSSSNQFSIELSDADGDFSEPVVVFTSDPGTVTTSPATLSFSLPTDTAGENYRIRVKASSPVATSSNSVPFAAYFRLQDSPFSINNLVSTGAYCTGSSYLLTIDNPGTGLNISPLQFPSLTYNWFRVTSPTTAVFITEAPTLSVNQEGTYFVETNYGTCTSNSFSNRVTISEVVSDQVDTDIVSSLGNPFCPSQGATILSTIGGLSHQWFLNGVIIPEATNRQFQTMESGIYTVQVDLGDCSASASIELESQLFDASINVSEITTIEQGETVSILVTNTAINPQFEWFLDDVLITDAVSDNFDATEFGNYRLVITETSGICNGSREFLFEIREALDPFPDVNNIPNLVSPNGDNINDTWVIPPIYVSGTNTEVIIMTSQGETVLRTNDYLNNWPENNLNLSSINQVFYYVITTPDNETKRGSITLVK